VTPHSKKWGEPMIVKDWTKIDLDTIDKAIQLGVKMLTLVPELDVSDDAKEAWRHELTASNQRMEELKPNYLDGSTKTKSPRDTVVLMMHCDLTQKFLILWEKRKKDAPSQDPPA